MTTEAEALAAFDTLLKFLSGTGAYRNSGGYGIDPKVISLYHRLQRSLKEVACREMLEPYGVDWIEDASAAQSLAFMVDILPTFHKYARSYQYGTRLALLDVGCGTGAGANLLASMHNGAFFGFSVAVDALDITDIYHTYIDLCFPLLNHIVSPVAAACPRKIWEFIVCSHVIEHVENPSEFLQQLQLRCKDKVFVYAPYREDMALAATGHINRIDEKFLAHFSPVEQRVTRSIGWRKSFSEDDPNECILAVLPGRAVSS